MRKYLNFNTNTNEKNILNQQKNVNPINSSSGLVGIITDSSNINIKNSKINSEQSILTYNNSEIDSENSNISEIISNDNNLIYSDNKLSGIHIRNNFSGNSLYNFPSTNFENRKQIQLNSVLDSAYSNLMTRPIINNGSEIKFGKFSDGILLNNLSAYIYDNGIRINSTNSTLLKYTIQNFLNNLPKDLNTNILKLIFIKNIQQNQIQILNHFGGIIDIEFNENITKIININNCSNVNISSNNKSCKLKLLNCNNIEINNINCEQLITESLLQIYNSKCIIKNSKFTSPNNNYVGIYANNSKVYLDNCNFINCKNNCKLQNFAMVDTSYKCKNIEEYQKEILSGEYKSYQHIDGFYKHLHTEYMPPATYLPNGSIIGYPRVINGDRYIDIYNQSSDEQKQQTGLLISKSMNNDLPSCYIPLDSNNQTIWKNTYKDKLNVLKQSNYLSGNLAYIKPFDSTTSESANSFNLYFGNIDGSTQYNKNITFFNNPQKTQLSTNVTFLSNVSCQVETGLTYDILPIQGNKGISISRYNYNKVTISNDKPVSAILDIVTICQKLVKNMPRETDGLEIKAFYKNVLKRSYLSFNIDGYKFKFSFEDILAENDIIKNWFNNNGLLVPTSKFQKDKIKIKFIKNISNIQLYYFGIPSNKNLDKIVGAGSNSDDNTIIQQFILNEDLLSGITLNALQNKTFKVNGTLDIHLKMPYSKEQYQFYGDSILCFYINSLSNQVKLNQSQLSNKNNNIFTYMIFRQAKDAYDASLNYILLSSQLSAKYHGLYQLSANTNQYNLYLYDQQTDSKTYTGYNIKKSSNKFSLYNENTKIKDLSTNIPSGTYIIENNTYKFYSKAYGNLKDLSNLYPNIVTDISLQHEKIPAKYMETSNLINIGYSYIPAYGYNFDFSKYSINSMVSGYYRLLGPNKKYIYQRNNRLKLSKIDGFAENLNILYETLLNQQVDIANPIFTYNTNNETYNIQLFDISDSLSTATYKLNMQILKSTLFVSLANRISNILQERHSNQINYQLDDIYYDVNLTEIYNNNIVSSTINRLNTTLNVARDQSTILDGFGMYYPIYKNNKFTNDNQVLFTNIPYNYHDNLYAGNTKFEQKFEYTIGNTTTQFKKYPLCNINKNSKTDFKLSLMSNSNLSGKLQYNELPEIYNINDSTFINATSARITYTGFIQYPFNLTNIKCYVNKVKIDSITKTNIQSKLIAGNNTVTIAGTLNGKTQYYITKIQGKPSLTQINVKSKFIPKYIKKFAFNQQISLDSPAQIKNFIANYNQPINFVCKKINAIWNQVLKQCDNQAALISYNFLFDKDVFIYGNYLNTTYTANVEFDSLTYINDINLPTLDKLFSIGPQIVWFKATSNSPVTNTNGNWFANNYNLSSII